MFCSKWTSHPHTIAKMNEGINMDSTIAESVNAGSLLMCMCGFSNKIVTKIFNINLQYHVYVFHEMMYIV